jgi:hypothetical protein
MIPSASELPRLMKAIKIDKIKESITALRGMSCRRRSYRS